MMNKAVFWDYDGTLGFARHLWSSVMLEGLNEVCENTGFTRIDMHNAIAGHGFTWDKPEKDFSCLSPDEWWEYALNYLESCYIKLGISADISRKARKKLRKKLIDPKRYELFWDTEKTLLAVQKLGYKNYLLSNNIPELKDILAVQGLDKLFDGVIISSLVGYDKPSISIYEIALKAAGNPKVSYMVGDNPLADAKGGKQAGMRTVLVHCSHSQSADININELSEIVDILKQEMPL